MTISETIQNHLDDMKSSVVIHKSMDEIYHPNYAWAFNDFRHIDISLYCDCYGITFRENDFCQARCLTTDFVLIANLIDSWIGLNKTLDEIKKKYDKVELFEIFIADNYSGDTAKENDWNEAKNFFFFEQYRIEILHLDICLEILNKARNDSTLRLLFPYSSHGGLCFGKISISQGLTNYLCIWPVILEPKRIKYFVKLPPNEEQLNFDNLEEAFGVIKKYIDKL